MMGFRTPFYDKNRKMMFQAIISSAINFPVFFSDDARDCLEGLLKKDPHARLGSGAGGADEIKAHAFYAPLDFGELFGGLKSVNSVFDVLPSWERLRELDTLLPIIGGLVALPIGFVGVRRATEWLRPDDAASARRKREERERLGVSEWDQEQESRNARDNVLAAVAILVFELVLFNMRGLIS